MGDGVDCGCFAGGDLYLVGLLLGFGSQNESVERCSRAHMHIHKTRQNFERFDEDAAMASPSSSGKKWAKADPNFIG